MPLLTAGLALRQVQDEDAALPRQVLHANGSAVSIDGLLGDRESQAKPALPLVEPHEGSERGLHLSRRETPAFVPGAQVPTVLLGGSRGRRPSRSMGHNERRPIPARPTAI